MALIGRSQAVRDLLKTRMHPLTVQEICHDLGYPMEDAKFVSSICVTAVKAGTVEAFPGRICGVTKQKCRAYMWASGATAAPRPRRPRAARPKAQAAPPPPRLTPEQQQRIAARRAAAEAAMNARIRQQSQQMAANNKVRAYLVFERHTGCRSRDQAIMKTAFRQACLKLHPDHGGDSLKMAELNAAWSEIG